MIRDTSAQDHVLSTTPVQGWVRGGRIFVSLLMVAALVYGLLQWMNSTRAVSTDRVRIAAVHRGTLVRDTVVTGRMVAAVSPTLYAPVASAVSLKIAAGESVRREQVLVVLDSPELNNERQREAATREQLEAEVARQRILAEQARQLARRDADEAELTRVAAQRDLQRIERGFRLGALPEIDFLKAQDTLRSAEIRAGHAAAGAKLAGQSALLELATKQQLLARQRLLVADLDRRVEGLMVRSPVDGMVGTLAVAERAVVAANTPLLTVVDLSRLEVEIEVPESYADDLGLGMSAELRLGALITSGRISAISPEVVGGQVLARVRFVDGQPDGLRQNQRVSTRILFEEKPGVLMLARGPFVENQGGRFAYVIEAGIAVRRPVQLGAISVSAVEVVAGLDVDEQVVISGTDLFEDAERVRLN